MRGVRDVVNNITVRMPGLSTFGGTILRTALSKELEQAFRATLAEGAAQPDEPAATSVA